MDVKIESSFCLMIKENPIKEKYRCQTICTSAAGIVVVAFQSGFHVFRTARFEAACQRKADEWNRNPEKNYLSSKHLNDFSFENTVYIPERQNIQFLSMSCDGLTLCIVLTRHAASNYLALFYDTRTILQQSCSPFLRLMDQHTSSHDVCNSVIWNPLQENRLMFCMSSGVVTVPTILENGTKYALQRLTSSKATCVSWSPRGKRIMVFRDDGYLEQFDAVKLTSIRLIDLKAHMPPNFAVVDILWFNNFSYILSAASRATDLTNPLILFVHAPKNGPVNVGSFEDVCYPSDALSVIPMNQFYMQYCLPWRFALLLSNRGTEIAIISVSDDCQSCSLIANEDEDSVIFSDGTRFTGFAMDSTVQTNGKGPLLYAVTSEGTILCQFVNRDMSYPSPCSAPTTMPISKGGTHIPHSTHLTDQTHTFSQLKSLGGSPVSRSDVPYKSNIVGKPVSSVSSVSGQELAVSLRSTSGSKLSTSDASYLSSHSPKSMTAGEIHSTKGNLTGGVVSLLHTSQSPQKVGKSLPSRAPTSPATAHALGKLVLSVSDRVNENLTANRQLFASIERALPSSSSAGGRGDKMTPLTELQMHGDRLQQHLEALNTVTREASKNAVQMSSESAANLEYVERIMVALKYKNQSTSGLMIKFDTPPVDPGVSHHLREMHSRVDNFEMLLDQANHQLDSLLSNSESAASERRRRRHGTAIQSSPIASSSISRVSSGMEDPKIHQLYAALRSNAGAISLQENRVGEISNLVERLSLKNESNGVTNGTSVIHDYQKQNLSAAQSSPSRRRQPDTAQSYVARGGWSTDRDSVLMKLLNNRKDIPQVKSSVVMSARSDDEKALFKKFDMPGRDDPTGPKISSHLSVSRPSDINSTLTSHHSPTKSTYGNRTTSMMSTKPLGDIDKYESAASQGVEKHVTFGDSTAAVVSMSNAGVPAPAGILKQGTGTAASKGLSPQVSQQMNVSRSGTSPNKVISSQPSKSHYLSGFLGSQESPGIQSSVTSSSLGSMLNAARMSVGCSSPSAVSPSTLQTSVPVGVSNLAFSRSGNIQPSSISTTQSYTGYFPDKAQSTMGSQAQQTMKQSSVTEPFLPTALSVGQASQVGQVASSSILPATSVISPITYANQNETKYDGQSSLYSITPSTLGETVQSNKMFSPTTLSDKVQTAGLSSPHGMMSSGDRSGYIHGHMELNTTATAASSSHLRPVTSSHPSSSMVSSLTKVPDAAFGNVTSTNNFHSTAASSVASSDSSFVTQAAGLDMRAGGLSMFSPKSSSQVTSPIPSQTHSPVSSQAQYLKNPLLTQKTTPTSSVSISNDRNLFNPSSVSAATSNFGGTAFSLNSASSPAITAAGSNSSGFFSQQQTPPNAASKSLFDSSIRETNVSSSITSSPISKTVTAASPPNVGLFGGTSISSPANTGTSLFSPPSAVGGGNENRGLFSPPSAAGGGNENRGLFSPPSAAGGGNENRGLFSSVPLSEATKSNTLFPSTSPAQASLFSNISPTPRASEPSLDNKTTLSSNFFGGSVSNSQPTSAFASSTAAMSNSLFENKPPAMASNSSGRSMFNQAVPSSTTNNNSSPFGQSVASAARPLMSPNADSRSSQAQPNPSLFGQPGNQAPQSSLSLFGNSTKSMSSVASSGAGGVFGSGSSGLFSTSTETPGSLFGSPSAPKSVSQSVSTAPASLFGSPTMGGGGMMSGLGSKPMAEGKNVFGSSMSSAPSSQSGNVPLLFGNAQSSPFGTTVSNVSSGNTLFGQSNSPPASALNPAGSGFGAPPTFGSPPVFGGGHGFGGAMSAAPSGFGDTRPAGGFAAIANQGGNLSFGSLAQGSAGGPPQMFGQQRSDASPQAFGSPNTSGSADFGGNPSFTRRRA